MADIGKELINAHVDMQLTAYFTNLQSGPGDTRYASSRLLDSTSWNQGVHVDPFDEASVQWVIKAAKQANKIPAILFDESQVDAIISRPGKHFEIDRERWMIAALDSTKRDPEIAQTKFSCSRAVVPSNEYFNVLANLFEDSSINQQFRDQYIPTLQAASGRPNVVPLHGLLTYSGTPVACGSAFVIDDLAGLYNVGTDVRQQKHGFGATISKLLMLEASRQGAKKMFLQCVVGTHVERLYERIGFRSIGLPAICTIE
jgi:hypothetical protein